MRYYIVFIRNTIIYYHKLSHFSLNKWLFLRNKWLKIVEKSLLFPDKRL